MAEITVFPHSGAEPEPDFESGDGFSTMAVDDDVLGLLPSLGDKPWNLNPAITAITSELTGRLSDDSIAAMVAESADSLDTGRAVRGDSGRYYRVLALALRNEGSGWGPISDASHRPIGVNSVSQTVNWIEINHAGLGATRVAGLVITPDETLAGALDVGPSVGLDVTRITLRRRETLADHISYDGTDWVATQGNFTGMTFSGGTLTVPHANVFNRAITGGVNGGNSMDVALTARSGASATYNYSIGPGGVGNTSLEVAIRNSSGALVTTPDTNMRFTISRGTYMRTLNPADVNTTTYPGGNLWVYGVFEVAP